MIEARLQVAEQTIAELQRLVVMLADAASHSYPADQRKMNEIIEGWIGDDDCS